MPEDKPLHIPDQFDAARLITNGPERHGFDWAELDEHRKILGEMSEGLQWKTTFEPTESEIQAIEGIVNALDWLTDLAQAAGVLQRPPKSE